MEFNGNMLVADWILTQKLQKLCKVVCVVSSLCPALGMSQCPLERAGRACERVYTRV